MKNLLLFFFIIIVQNVKGQTSPSTTNRQKEEKISINNSRIKIAIEVNIGQSELTLDGNSKLYNRINDAQYGLQSPSIDDKLDFSIGGTLAYNLIHNTTKGSLNVGIYYLKHGDPVFISQGNLLDDFPKVFLADTMGYLKINTLRIPVFLHFRLFKIFGDEGVGIEFGSNLDFLLSALIVPGEAIQSVNLGSSIPNPISPQLDYKLSASKALSAFNANLFIGFRFQIGPLYVHGQYGIIPSKNIFTSKYANYNDKYKFEEQFITLGFGWFIK